MFVITNGMQNPLFNDILTNYFTGPAHLKKTPIEKTACHVRSRNKKRKKKWKEHEEGASTWLSDVTG